jgi:hypothetical protein
MPFGLCNAPTTFQRVVMMAFQDYLCHSMEIFLIFFCVFNTIAYHKEKQLCFNQCDQYGISSNVVKCHFFA